MVIALGNWAWQRDLANWGRSKFYQEIIIKPRKYGHTDSGESIYSWMNGRLCAAVPWRPTKSRTYKMLRLFILPPNEGQQCMAGFYIIWSLEEKVAFGCMHLSGKWRRNGFKENLEQTWHSCRASHLSCGPQQMWHQSTCKLSILKMLWVFGMSHITKPYPSAIQLPEYPIPPCTVCHKNAHGNISGTKRGIIYTLVSKQLETISEIKTKIFLKK